MRICKRRAGTFSSARVLGASDSVLRNKVTATNSFRCLATPIALPLLRFSPSPPTTTELPQSRQDGGSQEDQKDTGEHQQQVSSRDEEWQVHSWLQDDPQVPSRWKGEARYHCEQLSPIEEVRD